MDPEDFPGEAEHPTFQLTDSPGTNLDAAHVIVSCVGHTYNNPELLAVLAATGAIGTVKHPGFRRE